jgi:hypothetical protein
MWAVAGTHIGFVAGRKGKRALFSQRMTIP